MRPQRPPDAIPRNRRPAAEADIGELTGDLSVDIDPDVIAEALAAVERSTRQPQVAVDGAEEAGFDIEIPSAGEAPVEEPARADERPRAEARPGTEARPGQEARPSLEALKAAKRAAEERRRLLDTIREQMAQMALLQENLAHEVKQRLDMDAQLKEAQKVMAARAGEVDAIRGRARKERDDVERGAEDRTLRGALDVFDNLERALSHAAGDPAKLLDGLGMIHNQFQQWLKNVGAERIVASRGTVFNPASHEAMMYVQDEQIPPGRIIQEIAAGFRVRGRLLRPARVIVSATPPGE